VHTVFLKIRGLKKAPDHAIRNDHIKQRIANQIINENDAEEFQASLPEQRFKAGLLDDQNAVDHVMLVESEQEILADGFRNKCQYAHFTPCED
jgi:hypothetical protein